MSTANLREVGAVILLEPLAQPSLDVTEIPGKDLSLGQLLGKTYSITKLSKYNS